MRSSVASGPKTELNDQLFGGRPGARLLRCAGNTHRISADWRAKWPWANERNSNEHSRTDPLVAPNARMGGAAVAVAATSSICDDEKTLRLISEHIQFSD